MKADVVKLGSSSWNWGWRLKLGWRGKGSESRPFQDNGALGEKRRESIRRPTAKDGGSRENQKSMWCVTSRKQHRHSAFLLSGQLSPCWVWLPLPGWPVGWSPLAQSPPAGLNNKAGLDGIYRMSVAHTWVSDVQICPSLHHLQPCTQQRFPRASGGMGQGEHRKHHHKTQQYFQNSTLLLSDCFHQPPDSFWFISIHKQTNASLCFYCSSRIGLLLEENNVSTTTALLNADLH